MLKSFTLVFVSFVILSFGVTIPQRAQAQTYQIDCAILLCLAGGWPASTPCTRARAEFMRRITPWPVEPPLQIWRCPMRVSQVQINRDIERRYDSRSDLRHISISPLATEIYRSAGPVQIEPRLRNSTYTSPSALWSPGSMVQRVQDRADIDISGPAFDFVRSIRVFHARAAKQKESDNTGDCNRNANILLGHYGTQGEFSWNASSINALPSAHLGLERWGEDCPELDHRSVFVDWRDYHGSYGYEQVNY